MAMIFMERDGFAVRHKPSPVAPEHVIEFEVLQWIECSRKGVHDGSTFKQFVDGSGVTDAYVDDDARASVYASGSLKWDGCINFKFDEQERCCLHFCGRSHIESLSRLLPWLYDVLGPLIPQWDG